MSTATTVVHAKYVSQYKAKSAVMVASTLHPGGDALGLIDSVSSVRPESCD